MKNITLKLLLLFVFLFNGKLKAQTKPDIDKVDNAVVIVMIYDYQGNYVGHGSGFVIDDKGTVVTNYHVVKGASSLKVKIDNNGYKEVYDVENIISGDESKDLVKISLKNSSSKKFPFLTLSKTFPAKGDDCWAIGTPADEKYMNTVSRGLISNIDKFSTPKMLQTNAEITHGSSGGVLINNKGEVIGVTSAGDGTEDGARASINFAIWIGELNVLSPINKKSIVDPSSIPCQLSFYTNSPYTGSVYFYIDGNYVGSFSKYFQNNYTPTCGDDGTITRYLYSGTHTYQVYYVSIGKWYYGTIALNPGQCQIFKVGGLSPSNNTGNFYNYSVYSREKIEDRGTSKWFIATGFSFVETGRGLPLPLFVEKYISDKYSLRGNIQWIKRDSDKSAGINYSNKYFGIGFDYKKIFSSPYRWNWFLAATCNYRFVNIRHEIYETTFPTGGGNNFPITVDNSYNENKNHFFTGIRFGGDRYSGQRCYITWDLGLGYNSFHKGISSDMNLLIGYRF